jgi:riboflavin kinase/FMN adenylyltransferase
MDVVDSVEGLRAEHGPVFAVIGVFDGLHLGHAYLLEHLVREARARGARPTVITFDHHPDEVLTGSAPPLLLHPEERLARLEQAGAEVVVVQPFDDAVRRTPYDAFVDEIRERTALAGLLMTPDAAFGFERRGTPEAVAGLGREHGFDLVVVPPCTLDGQLVSSSAIRAAIARGDLAGAQRLLGRPVGLRGTVRDGRLVCDWPMATPPSGEYQVTIDGRVSHADIDDRGISLRDPIADGSPVDVAFAP